MNYQVNKPKGAQSKIMYTQKKVTAPTGLSVSQILSGVNAGNFYTSYGAAIRAAGFSSVRAGISAFNAVGVKHDLHVIQIANIPSGVRGNLSKFAGKKVQVVVTCVGRGTTSFETYIKEV